MFDVVSLVTTIPLPPIVAFTDSIKTAVHGTVHMHKLSSPESKQNIYFYYLLVLLHILHQQRQMYGVGEEKALN